MIDKRLKLHTEANCQKIISFTNLQFMRRVYFKMHFECNVLEFSIRKALSFFLKKKKMKNARYELKKFTL